MVEATYDSVMYLECPNCGCPDVAANPDAKTVICPSCGETIIVDNPWF